MLARATPYADPGADELARTSKRVGGGLGGGRHGDGDPCSKRIGGPGKRAPYDRRAPGVRLERLYSKTPPSTVRGCANRTGEPSGDPEVGGVEGLCIDEVELAAWIGRFVQGCLGIQDGPGATAASCRADIVGVDSSESATAAWAGWFAARLEVGGCRTIFSLMAAAAGRLARAGRPLVRALSAPSSSAALNRALHEWLSAPHSGDHETPAQTRALRADFEACRPSPC